MANEDFNKMLDDYMGSIRKKDLIHFSEKFKKFFKSKHKKKIQIDQDTTEEYIDVRNDRLESAVVEEKKGFFSRFLELFSPKHKEISEEEFETAFEEPEVKVEEPETEEFVVKEMKENFISRFFKRIFHPRKKHVEEPEVKTYSSEMNEDVVKVLNIVNSLFKKLPQNVKQDFRNSEDFEVYANVLKKYRIIKKP